MSEFDKLFCAFMAGFDLVVVIAAFAPNFL